MEPTYYVSPTGVEQLVSTQIEANRLKYRGWRPKEEVQRETAEPEVSPANRKPKLPKAKRPAPKPVDSE